MGHDPGVDRGGIDEGEDGRAGYRGQVQHRQKWPSGLANVACDVIDGGCVNGTQVATGAASGAIQSSTNPLWIGGNNPYGEYFQGLIDEARVHNRALTATDIQAAMNAPLN